MNLVMDPEIVIAMTTETDAIGMKIAVVAVVLHPHAPRYQPRSAVCPILIIDIEADRPS